MESLSKLIDPSTFYRLTIRAVLEQAVPDGVGPEGLEIVPVFDLKTDRYQLLCQGWTSTGRRVFYPVVHIELIAGKVWVQHNQSDIDFGERLYQQGVPKSDIVLGLHPDRKSVV